MKRTIKHPEAKAEWKDHSRAFSMKVGFQLTLSKTMLEMICAIADDVHWDRALYWGNQHWPDNWIAPLNALLKRGLIERKPQEEIDRRKHRDQSHEEWAEWGFYRLTPPGEKIVDLLKLCGMFVEADAAINKKARKRA